MLLAPLALGFVLSARGQEGSPQVFTLDDREVDDALDRAGSLERQGTFAEAGEEYAKLVDLLAKKREKDPDQRIVTRASSETDRGVAIVLRERLRALPEEGIQAYRALVDPKARVLLEDALDQSDEEAVEAAAERYPLSSAAARALQILGSQAFERGDLGRAGRVFARLERDSLREVSGGAAPADARRWAFARLCAAAGRGDAGDAADALASFVAKGGNADEPRIPAGGKLLTAHEAVERARALAPAARPSAAVDPGRLERSLELDSPELPQDLADRLERVGGLVPAYQQPVFDAETGLLLVCDEKTVRAVDPSGHGGGWSFAITRDASEPGRLEVANVFPALGAGRVFATLHLNRPVKHVPRPAAAPGANPGAPNPGPPGAKGKKPRKADKDDDEDDVVRQPDWRVVALERKTGRLLWDAVDARSGSGAGASRFEDFARDAEWVSSPCFADGQVFVSALARRGSDLRCYLVAMDAATGRVRWRAFLASRVPFDFLGIGSPPAAPVARGGLVYVATGLGAIACVDAARGDLAWLTRYPTSPERSQPEIVRAELRFRAASPLFLSNMLVVAPVDAQEVLALDPATGQRRWRAPRGQAHVVAGTPAGCLLLVSDRVLALDGASGLCRFESEPLGGAALAPPVCADKEALLPLPSALVRISLEDGKLLGRFRYEHAPLEAGALAPCGEGRVATASWARANVYGDRALVARAASSLDRAEGALLLGESAGRRGESAEAERQLELAIASGLPRDLAARARRLAFAVFAEHAAREKAAGHRDGFLTAAARALDHGDRALEDARRGAEGPGASNAETIELVQRSATLRRSLADALAQGTTVEAWTKAADQYQKLLLAPSGTLVALDGGLAVDARAYARKRVRELVRTRGRDCYALEDRSAAEHVKSALATGTKEGFERVIELYPASGSLAEALWGLQRFYIASGLESDAAATLERFLADEPDETLVPEALARLALLEERLRRPARARAFAKRLAAQAGDARVRGSLADGSPERSAAEVARDILARTGAGDPDALVRQDAASQVEPPLRRVFRSTTELSATGAELIEPRNLAGGPVDRYVVRRVSTIEARSTETGVVALRIDSPQGLQPERRWLGWSGGLLLAPSTSALMGYDAATGKLLWQTSFPARIGRPAIAPDDLHAVEYGDSTALVLTRWNELHALDSRTGKELWTRPLVRGDADGGIFARGKLGVVAAVYPSAPSKLEAFDLDTGKTTWTWAPDAAPGVVPRIGLVRWIGSDALACVIDSRKLALLDAATGNLRWTASAGETGWFGDPEATPSADAVVVRGLGGGPAFWVYDAKTGKEVWRDDGYGAVLPGPRPETEGVLPLVEEVIAGENAVYTFRQRAGGTEIWSQQLTTGTKLWQWEAHGVRTPTALVETPTSILVARDGRFDRAQLIVLGKGTGKPDEQISLPGRKLVGRGLVAAGGCVVVSTDRGTFGLTHVDDELLGRETLAATLELAAHETPENRAALADKLARANPPRVEEAIDSCSKALLAEGTGLSPESYDRLFAQLAALSEASVELAPPHYDVRRMPRPPEIDGELNDWWRDWSAVDLTGPRYISPIQLESGRPGRWNGPEDLSAKLYMGWDEKYFYFALDVLDSDLRPFDSESPKWIGDCLLIAIDTKNDGGYWFAPDDVLLSLALTLPKKKKEDDKKKEGEEEDKNKPEGKYFVKRKDDGSGAIYEAQVPWSLYAQNGATNPGQSGFTFGFNVILTDDDGDRIGPEDLPAGVDPKTLPEGKREGDYRGALKTLQLTPSVLLHEKKDRLWQGYIPEYFAKITLR